MNVCIANRFFAHKTIDQCNNDGYHTRNTDADYKSNSNDWKQQYSAAFMHLVL